MIVAFEDKGSNEKFCMNICTNTHFTLKTMSKNGSQVFQENLFSDKWLVRTNIFFQFDSF